jgi:hypothetical protein
LYQRKRKLNSWEDVSPVKLSQVRADEAVAIELSSEEILTLRDTLNDLQSIRDAFGVPATDTYFVGVQTNTLADRYFHGAPERTLVVPVTAGASSMVEALTLLLQREDFGAVVRAMQALSTERLTELQVQAGISVLDQLLAAWDSDPNNESEEHWQALFGQFSFALEQIFHVPTVLIKSKAYVGGKQIDNTGGKLADFILETSTTSAAVIVEIKTPTTKLLNDSAPYRENAWGPSRDLAGSVVQVLTYRDTLLEQMADVAEDTNLLRRVLPKCAILIGSASSLTDSDKRRSFERFRSRPDVSVMTFDELNSRLRRIREVMSMNPTE